MKKEAIPIAELDVDALAAAFCRVLRSWLSSGELSAVAARNREYAAQGNPEFCATHEYCDPNEAMLEALGSFNVDIDSLFPPGPETSPAWDVIESAWGKAKASDFSL